MSGMLFLMISIVSAVNAGRPVFEKTVEQVTLQPYERSELFCNASGEVPMEYTWYDEHNLEVGFDHDHFIYTLPTEGGSYLVLEQPDRNGTFTCSAVNQHGRSSKIFEVFVLGAGNPVIKSLRVLNITDTSVVFAVSATPNTRSIVATYQEDQDKTSQSKTITIYDVGRMESVFELDNLVPGGKYKFQFLAVSADGDNTPRENLIEMKDVILLPPAPELIFLGMREGSVKIQWFKKFDDIRRETILDYTISYGPVFMRRGNEWDSSECPTTVVVPVCGTSSYTISDLSKSTFYEIQVKARTETGYGKPSKFKVYVQ